ncbi:Variant-specific surface protein [Giardia duodenalis]|uniref:Variant-specific surface protein n=2 Tax=Giardia intestinalis TaxID=5741 RepID=V6TFC4_GIAIN|nr:Variant-specific surface protein [Giardia intestinalis]
MGNLCYPHLYVIAESMFTGLIFASLVLQLAAATRPAEKSRSGNACTESGNNTCQTCSGSGSNEICLTCKDSANFLTANRKGCKAACDAEKEIQDPDASPKACKCDGSKGYQLQSDGTCAKAPGNTCTESGNNTCQTCSGSGSNEICLTCKDSANFLTANRKGCKAACDAEKEIQDPDASPKACKCDGSKGYQLQSDGTCAKAPGNTCKESGNNTCQTCSGSGSNEICLTCKDSANFLTANRKGCKAACDAEKEIQDPDASPKACKCDGSKGYQLQNDGTCGKSPAQCNTPNCKACDNPKTDSEICTECNDGNYLTPTKQCTQSCGTIGNYYNGNKACEPCDPSCAACTTTGPAKCTACPPGKMLKYTNDDPNQGGSCVDECKPQSGASGCETCGATIGGTRYCSKCSTSTEVPVNGVCTADNARAPVCSKKDNQGGCATCASGYFRQDNGCYKTDRQPGIQICTLASQGDKCETCANSLPPSAAGVCPSCDSACKTCTSANNANTCSSCVVGYYQVGTKCVRCDTNDPNGNKPITGVRDCVSCAPPAGGDGGSVLCYLMKDGDSTNKSGLSTGAIAGISVAVIVVVGGLVGFLCWWFLCRGKA